MDSARILVVEDEKHLAANIARCLIQLGHDVVGTATSGRDALQIAAQTHPDLVLMDIMLEGVQDGISTAASLRAELNLSVIYMTAHTNEGIIQRAKLTDPLGYIHKPFEESSLGVAIEMAIYRLKLESEREQIRKELDTVTEELRDVNARLAVSAVMDPLTEVYNRRGLQQILTRELHLARRSGQPLMAVVLDLDDFKKVNDTLGHLSGDIVLKETVKRIRESLRISDYIGRIGGDEFLLLLPQTSLEDGSRLAERLRLSFAGLHMQLSEAPNLRISASIGLAPVTNQVISVADIVSLIDPLLKESKNNGKNQVHFESPKSFPSVAVHSDRYLPRYSEDLRRSELFFPVKQSIRNLRSDTIAGVEYLTRMRHDFIGMPDDFFRAAIESDLVTLVDHHCFNACVHASSEMPKEATHHINLLPSTIMDAPVDWLVEKISIYQKKYCLELCEQGLGHSVQFREAILSLKERGIEIAIDDVGFGNTCLETILFIEPNVIKIDKKCIIGISNHQSMQKILGHIVKIGEDLNARVIAEGIETREDLATVLSLGVEYGQGYYWGQPS